MAARYNGHKDDDDDYDYSDSFVSDDDDESVKKHPTTRKVAQGTLQLINVHDACNNNEYWT